MNKYMLDTTTFSALMERDARALARLDALETPYQAVICPIVRGEVLHGLRRMPHGRRRQHLEDTASRLFRRIPCEVIPVAAGDAYATVKFDAERKGTPLGENDLWIAAMAVMSDATVVSSDSDFRKVDGLRTEDWTA